MTRIHPSPQSILANYAREAGARWLTLTPLIGFTAYQISRGHWRYASAMIPAAVALVGCVVGSAIYCVRCSISWDDDTLVIQRIVRRHTVDRSVLTRIRLFRVHPESTFGNEGSGIPSLRMVFSGDGGHGLAAISSWGWTLPQAVQLGEKLGCPVDDAFRTLDVDDFMATFPGLERPGFLSAYGGCAIVIVLIGVGIWVQSVVR